MLLFEDVDTVFVDETEFYSQLAKLCLVTKVPILMTASNFEYVSRHLLPILNKHKDQFTFECISYQARRPETRDLLTLCLFIKLFEGYVAQVLEPLPSLDSRAIEQMVE